MTVRYGQRSQTPTFSSEFDMPVSTYVSRATGVAGNEKLKSGLRLLTF
jgi:hypothetical protein